MTSLVHPEPSPRGMKIVPQILLPKYGWPHKEAGKKYPLDEKSFRLTLTYQERTNKGFTFDIDFANQRIIVTFDHLSVADDQQEWLDSVKDRVGPQNLEPIPPAIIMA